VGEDRASDVAVAPRDAVASGSTGPWALVTGACSGIGLESARELARRGYPLILVSDRGPALEEAARRLENECDVSTRVIVMDLAQPGAALDLYEEVRRLGLEVDVLVSNAGFFFFGEMADADPGRAEAMLQLHVVTPSLLARHFGRDMRERRRGHILFVSSISAWRDFPGIAWYGSSKRYLRSFARALHDELGVWGVTVTCLAPGAVATNLYEQTGVPVRTAVRIGVMKDPAGVARAGVKAMFRGRAVVIPGLSAKMMALGMAAMPRWLIRAVRRYSPLLPRPRD